MTENGSCSAAFYGSVALRTFPAITSQSKKAIAFAFLHQRWLRIGAADEARTRYLHLGKVALYQMSYGRIFGAFVPAPSHSYFKRDPRESLRSKILWGRGGISEFVTVVLLVRLPDKRLTFRRSDPDRARTDDPQRDRLVL